MKIRDLGIIKYRQPSIPSQNAVGKADATINREFVYASYPIAFGCNPGDLSFVRKARGLHCPYCGKKMIHPEEFRALDFLPMITAKTALDRIRLICDELRQSPLLREVHLKIKAASRQSSEEPFEEINLAFGLKRYSKAFEKIRKAQLPPKHLRAVIIRELLPQVDKMPLDKQDLFQQVRLLHNQEKIAVALQASPNEVFVKVLDRLEDAKSNPLLKGLLEQQLTPSEYASKVLDTLSVYRSTMKPVQRSVFEKLKFMNEIHPNMAIEDLILLMRPNALQRLHEAQFRVLKKLSKKIKVLPKEISVPLEQAIKSARAIIKGPNSDGFRRKEFINEVINIIRQSQDKTNSGEIYKIIFQLPTSVNNADAFIVKYSGEAPQMEHGDVIIARRSTREIAQSILLPSVMTLDHIVPQHILEHTNVPTPRGNSNFLPTCGPCNSTAKNGLTLGKFIQKRPNVREHIINFMRELVGATNAGKIDDLRYPRDVARTIVAESHGQIKSEELSLEKINPPKPSAETILKQDYRFAQYFRR